MTFTLKMSIGDSPPHIIINMNVIASHQSSDNIVSMSLSANNSLLELGLHIDDHLTK